MKLSELRVGETYEVMYRHTVNSKDKAIFGVAKLVSVDKVSGWHKFNLRGTRKTVYAHSRGVLGPASPKTLFMSEEIVPKSEISDEVKKLRKIGLDDSLRKQEVEALVVFLDGLGVKSAANEDYTEITIKYLHIATLKTVLARVYQQALEVE